MRRRLAHLVAAAALAGCGAQRPATVRAVAVAVGSFGTGTATAAQTCNTRPWTECRQVALTGLVVALGVSLSAGAVAFLEQDGQDGKGGTSDGGR
jgi:hypothetical protein